MIRYNYTDVLGIQLGYNGRFMEYCLIPSGTPTLQWKTHHVYTVDDFLVGKLPMIFMEVSVH